MSRRFSIRGFPIRPAMLCVAAALLLAACETVPATGESVFTGFTPLSSEAALGAQEHPKILSQFGGEYDDPELAAYVASVGKLLASASELPQLDWRFTVIDSDIVNAFALPGGYVYVTRGLIALARDEAEMAAVLAHEIGHVTARHSAQRQGQGLMAGIGALAAGILLGDAGASIGSTLGQGYVASYSRSQEHQADELGVRYLSRVGFDPNAMSGFLAGMQAQSELLARIQGKEQSEASWLATHPPTGERVTAASAAAQGISIRDPMRGRDTFLAKIDGMTYGDSPENGLIRGRSFIHPVLRFRFEVPESFKLVNTASKVGAVGPDGAVIVMDMAKSGGATGMAAYLQNVWAARTRLAGVENITINGLPAATGTTRVQSRNGAVDMRLVAIRGDGDTVYRLQFATPSAQTARLANDLQRTTYSFRRLSAAEAARVRPYRIRIRTVRSGDTLASLAAGMPYTDHREDRMRVLNGLRPGETLQPGTKVKTIVE